MEFLQLLHRFVPPYRGRLALNIIFNLLATVLSLFSFAAIIPLLQISFGISTVDTDGNFNFLLMGTQTTKEDVQKYVDENDILFSVAFGPILVREGELQQYDWYPVGEIEKEYSRAGLAQCDSRHYFYMTVSNSEFEYTPLCTINQFAELMFSKGVKNAYALDGGQTAELVFDGEPFNHIDYGAERSVSDIIYFASALGKAEVTVK